MRATARATHTAVSCHAKTYHLGWQCHSCGERVCPRLMQPG
jgi:hypothetical protein